jgi:glycosyltransferase involved in cell wall biosynthesis
VHFPFIQKKLQYTSINKKSRFVITFVGSVTLRKGLPYLLEAIAIAKDFELQVNIVGHYDKKFLEHLSKLRLLDERLIFHGALPRDRVVALLSISDIFVMPSVEEGWPIAWLEAMSMGCVPIVSDAICKLSEAPILDRRMFFQSGNSTDLAEKIFYFYNNPEALQMSKIEVRSTMNNSETWHDFAIQVLEIAKSHKDT